MCIQRNYTRINGFVNLSEHSRYRQDYAPYTIDTRTIDS